MNSSTVLFNFKHHNTEIIENLFLGQQREEKKYNLTFNHKFRTQQLTFFFFCLNNI